MRIEVPKEMHRGKLREVNEAVVAEYRATGGQLVTARGRRDAAVGAHDRRCLPVCARGTGAPARP